MAPPIEAVPNRPDAAPLPPFCRLSWTSEATRLLWEPRLEQIRTALEDIAFDQTVAAGAGGFPVRPSALDRLRRRALEQGLPFSVDETAANGPFATAYGLAGRRWLHLGTPPVPPRLGRCRCQQPSEQEGVDPIWTLAANSAGGERFDAGNGIALDGLWGANPLLAAVGLKPSAIWPCHARCERAQQVAEALVADGDLSGHAESLGWLRHILSWPISWTALHGIAEVKTPVFRYVRDTAQTRQRLSVRWLGRELPEAAAKGLDFPFQSRFGLAPVPGRPR